MIRAAASLAIVLAGALGIGCVDPLVPDEVVTAPGDSPILPAGALVAALDDDAALAAQVDEHDGVDRLVPLQSAFASGEQVRYWTFGAAPDRIAPVYVLGRATADGGFERSVDHPSVFDTIPGDAGYSPFWQVFGVVVTDAYDDELLPSLAAIERARDEGLVEPPAPLPMYVNCPIVLGDVRLEVGAGAPPAPPIWGFYRGVRVAYHTFMPMLVTEQPLTRFPVADVYVLRREGGEPLSEPLRRVDMTGDGDTVDSDNIFEVGLDDAGYTPLWRMVEVVVPADYRSIDVSGDEADADFKAVGDLFGVEDGVAVPRADHVIAYTPSEVLLNCPLQTAPGAGGS